MSGPRDALEALLPEMETVRSVRYGSNIDWYDVLNRAAFAKAFDFAHWTLLQDEESGISYWVVSTLRGIVEEIILLSAVQHMSRQDRDRLLSSWMHLDLLEGTKKQAAFFAIPERFQSVLGPPPAADDTIAALRAEMRNVWQSYHLDPGHTAKGNIRSLAAAANLLVIYDYFYELASRLVHFSPSVLLRSGWGSLHAGTIDAAFRPSNFDDYYTALARTHSVFLLAEFIERFGAYLNVSETFTAAAESIRDELRTVRFPELITFEEMNIKPPGVLLRAIEALVRTGDIPADQFEESIE